MYSRCRGAIAVLPLQRLQREYSYGNFRSTNLYMCHMLWIVPLKDVTLTWVLLKIWTRVFCHSSKLNGYPMVLKCEQIVILGEIKQLLLCISLAPRGSCSRWMLTVVLSFTSFWQGIARFLRSRTRDLKHSWLKVCNTAVSVEWNPNTKTSPACATEKKEDKHAEMSVTVLPG